MFYLQFKYTIKFTKTKTYTSFKSTFVFYQGPPIHFHTSLLAPGLDREIANEHFPNDMQMMFAVFLLKGLQSNCHITRGCNSD